MTSCCSFLECLFKSLKIKYNVKIQLQPKNFKSKKRQKGRSLIKFNSNYKLNYGDSGLSILRPLIFTSNQLSKIKIFLKKAGKRNDKARKKMWVNLFPHLPFSKKPSNVRMGKGKGKLKTWFIQVRGGTVMFEYKNLKYGKTIYYFNQLSKRIGVPTKKIFRKHVFFDFFIKTKKKFFVRPFWY